RRTCAESLQDLERGGLTRPVGSEHHQDLPAPRLECHITQYVGGVVAHSQRADIEYYTVTRSHETSNCRTSTICSIRTTYRSGNTPPPVRHGKSASELLSPRPFRGRLPEANCGPIRSTAAA